MTSTKDIPYLVELLEDESPAVREGVLQGFLAFGSELEPEISRLPKPLSAEQRYTLDEVLAAHFCGQVRDAWPDWLELPSDNQKLEAGYALIARLQDGPSDDESLGAQLDTLAEDYRTGSGGAPDPASLVQYLFFAREFRGASEDYHQAHNSNLAYVLRQRRGIPISLACLAILVAERLGLQVHGCNFPGHFLARFGEGEDTVFVDCFSGGRFYREAELSSRFPGESGPENTHALTPASTEAIFARVLRNLVYAYGNVGDRRRRECVQDMLHELERTPMSLSKPLFEPGQLVRHRHYDYHGVITAVDKVCQASDEWYASNRTQPDRNQPWYHVLVDGSDACTYAAQENLESDTEGLPIQHPLLEYFFTGFEHGRYIRNDRPWLIQ